MNRRIVITVSAATALGLAVLAAVSVAQQQSLKERLVGTWTFVSSVDVQKDGTKVDRWGSNPKGVFVFDTNGHYVLVINRSDLPKFASDRVDQGTAEENKAVMQGMIATFGTYSVNDADNVLTTQIDGGSFPNLYGKSQKRTITSLTAQELKWVNPSTTIGTTAEVVWRRTK
jgi:hypothetical protein